MYMYFFRYNTKPDFNIFKQEYIKLYVDTIKPIVTALDPSRTYLESSPSNGLDSVKEGFIASNPQSSLYGDGNNFIAESY